jgi:hypothetical protein
MKLVNKKDEEKIMHTANLIEEIADVVIDNNDSLEKLNILIDNISYLRSEQPLDLSNSIDVFPLDSDYREAIKQGINIIKEVDIPIHLLTLS